MHKFYHQVDLKSFSLWQHPIRDNHAFLHLTYIHYPVYSISVEFGAEVWIGKIKDGTNDDTIKVTGYFGVNPNNPKENYVYATINKFTLDSVFKAFELGTPDMPKFVRETGFPEGITVAYSLLGT